MQQLHPRQLITYYQNKYNNNLKAWNTVETTKIYHRDTKWASAVGKMTPIGLFEAELPQSFNLQKTQYLWSTIKQWMPVRLRIINPCLDPVRKVHDPLEMSISST